MLMLKKDEKSPNGQPKRNHVRGDVFDLMFYFRGCLGHLRISMATERFASELEAGWKILE